MEYVFDVIDKFVEFIIDSFLFPITAIIKSDFLGMIEKIGMLASIFSFNFLLEGCQSAE